MSQAQDLMESTLLASGVVTAVNTGAVGSSGNHLCKREPFGEKVFLTWYSEDSQYFRWKT